MIYTVTFNPAWDYYVHANGLKLGEVNRATYEAVYFGGKGINVSGVLNNLGFETVALGFVAGFTGDALEDGLKKQNIKTDFVKLSDGMTRINVKLNTGKETEINGNGPKITEGALAELMSKLDNIRTEDVLILSGSIPDTVPSDVYETIMRRLADKNAKIIVDATKDLLFNVLKYKPFLIKPNNHELGEIFGVELKTDKEIITYAKKLKEKGARNVLISMAGDGAILITEDGETIKSNVANGKVVNSVGAGDSMVAGFIAGYLKSGDYNEALKLGTACGGATAFSQGLATKDKIDEIYKTL